MIDFNSTAVFAASFLTAALGGLAALLRSNEPVNRAAVSKATLNSGLLGLGLSLGWYQTYSENPFFLVGICLLTGLGGSPSLDLILEVVRRLVTSFSMGSPNSKRTQEKSDE